MNHITILADHDLKIINFNKYIFNYLINLKIFSIFFKKNYIYKGHFAVTRSLITGLINANFKFSYNPQKLQQITKTCLVLSGRESLKSAIYYKKVGVIQNIIAGPNIVVIPSEFNKLIAHQAVDLCIVPSQWVKDLYLKDEPSLFGRIEIWAAGVDCNFWDKKRGAIKKWRNFKKVLIYIKNIEETVISSYENLLYNLGYVVKKIYYGQYSQQEYLNSLNSVDVAIFFSKSESQGIALFEAWATDTPTLVWNYGEWVSPKGVTYKASSAPYLSNLTGSFFSDLDQFQKILNNFDEISLEYDPRKWVCQYFSDEKSAARLSAIISNIESK
jgi:hypothetical protein